MPLSRVKHVFSPILSDIGHFSGPPLLKVKSLDSVLHNSYFLLVLVHVVVLVQHRETVHVDATFSRVSKADCGLGRQSGTAHKSVCAHYPRLACQRYHIGRRLGAIVLKTTAASH